MLPADTESDLIRQARGGDTRAFEDLLWPLVAPACRLAYTLLHDWEEAEDAVQESALKAWRFLPRLRPGTTQLRAWFFAIVVNQARSVRRRRGFSTILLGGKEPQSWARPDASLPDDALDLRRAMTRLNEGQRALLFLHYALDLPLDEAGAALGLSPIAAKSKLYRALRALRPALEVAEV